MLEHFRARRFGGWLGGFLLGAVVAGAAVAGFYALRGPSVVLSDLPIFAQAQVPNPGMGSSLLLATGAIADGQDGVVVLDKMTSDLNIWGINPRTGQVTAVWKHNVALDMELDRGKTPDYCLAVGRASFQGGGPANQLAGMVIYVGDGGSGNVAGYIVPWNNQTRWNAPQGGVLRRVFLNKARAIAIEGEQ